MRCRCTSSGVLEANTQGLHDQLLLPAGDDSVRESLEPAELGQRNGERDIGEFQLSR
jgi:hypothetical protein